MKCIESGGAGAFFERMAELEREGAVYAVATVVESVGSSPRHAGAKMLVFPDGSILDTIGGGKLEKIVVDDALEAIAAGSSFLKTYKLLSGEEGGIGAACGGETKVFIETRGAGPRLVIIGGGHVGLALSRIACETGFSVTVVDGREEFAEPGRFAAAVRTIRTDPAGPGAAAQVAQGAWVVILTHSHELDAGALRNMLGTPARYIGVIGSRRKAAGMIEGLRAEGVADADLARVFTPVGLDIGAETPGEIAVSILAEIIHLRSKGESNSMAMSRKCAG